MSSKFKMLRKQVSFAARSLDVVEEDESKSRSIDSFSGGKTFVKNTRSADTDENILRKKNTRRRHRTSLGVLEDVIKCPICKQIMQLPRMLPCQHTFCKKCLELKFDEDPRNKDNIFRCPVCKSETTSNVTRDNLPANLSIESVLRAVDHVTFIESRPQSLRVNFAPLTNDERRISALRCVKCETIGEPVESCRHCNQTFCQLCEVQHVSRLKLHFEKIIEQLRGTGDGLERRLVEFQDKTDNLKNAITKEYDAKIAALHEERIKKLGAVDDFRRKGENSAIELKKRLSSWQDELAEQTKRYDNIGDDKEKIEKFLELHRKTTEIIASASNWQTKVDDMVETKTTAVISKLQDGKDNVDSVAAKTTYKPKRVYDKKELQRPSGLALDSRRGEIYVTCAGSAVILVFDGQYRLLRRIQNPNLMAPQGITFVDSLQEIFVTDKWKHTIYVFGRKGQLVRKIGGKGNERGRLRCPEGIDVLQSRNWIYVADTGNDRIQILGVDGAYKGGIGPPTDNRLRRRDRIDDSYVDANNGQIAVSGGDGGNDSVNDRTLVSVHGFKQPTDVAVSVDVIVVADCGHNKIKVFNHKCQLLFSIGGLGTFKGLFKSPEVVDLDDQDNIYVGDSDNGRIQVFDSRGIFLRTHGVQGTLVGHFGLVSGLLVLPSNEILVTDSKRNTLELI